MAGLYADVPGHRLAWDRDGSILFRTDYGSGGTVTQLSQTDADELNDEDSGEVMLTGGGTYGLGWIFPEARDIVGYALWYNKPYSSWTPMSIETSTNTTNGADGTWTNHGAWVEALVLDDLRDSIQSVSWSGVKGIRVRANQSGSGTAYLKVAHFYMPSMSSGPNRLLFWQPTGTNAEVRGAYFDWGDVPRGSSYERSFRVHNPSASLTATAVTVSMEALTDTSPSNTGQHEFSTNGGSTWAATATIGDLAPGATSGDVILRRSTSGSAALGLWWTRMVASASGWS